MFKATNRTQTSATFKPCLEALEDRCLLDASNPLVNLQSLYSLIPNTSVQQFLYQVTAEITRESAIAQTAQIAQYAPPDQLVQLAQQAAYQASVPSLQQSYNNLGYVATSNPSAIGQAEADFIGNFMGLTPQQAQNFLNNQSASSNPLANVGAGLEAFTEDKVMNNNNVGWLQTLQQAVQQLGQDIKNILQKKFSPSNLFQRYIQQIQGSSQNTSSSLTITSSNGSTVTRSQLVYASPADIGQSLLGSNRMGSGLFAGSGSLTL